MRGWEECALSAQLVLVDMQQDAASPGQAGEAAGTALRAWTVLQLRHGSGCLQQGKDGWAKLFFAGLKAEDLINDPSMLITNLKRGECGQGSPAHPINPTAQFSQKN